MHVARLGRPAGLFRPCRARRLGARHRGADAGKGTLRHGVPDRGGAPVLCACAAASRSSPACLDEAALGRAAALDRYERRALSRRKFTIRVRRCVPAHISCSGSYTRRQPMRTGACAHHFGQNQPRGMDPMRTISAERTRAAHSKRNLAERTGCAIPTQADRMGRTQGGTAGEGHFVERPERCASQPPISQTNPGQCRPQARS
jgi:hypothetical protein